MVLYGALSISKTSFVRLRILRQHEMALLDVAYDVRRGALTDGWQPLILLKFLSYCGNVLISARDLKWTIL
jgi:hypothetical protein